MSGGYGGPVLLDNSAWAKLILLGSSGGKHALAAADVARWEAAVEADQVCVCAPFMLEALYSARTAVDFAKLATELAAFREAEPDEALWARALTAQRQLAEAKAVSHRVKAVDLLVAALAHSNRLAVLHYDHDYDVIAANTDLAIGSLWVAPRGSLP